MKVFRSLRDAVYWIVAWPFCELPRVAALSIKSEVLRIVGKLRRSILDHMTLKNHGCEKVKKQP